MTANPTKQNTHDPDQSDQTNPTGFLFWSLFIPVLLGCLGMAIALYSVSQKGSHHFNAVSPTDFRHIPPELIGYRQTSVSVCPVKGTPTCFAVQNDSTFIVGTADPHALYFFDEQGTLQKTFDLSEEPKAVVCGTANTIFSDTIIVSQPSGIALYNTDGGLTDSWKGEDGAEIRSLSLSSDYLFAADSGKCLIYRFDLLGKKHIFGDPSAEEPDAFGGFVVYAAPITMTCSAQTGLLYISNPGKHRVEVFTQDGLHKPEFSWGEPSSEISGFAGCCNPIGLAVLGNESVLTVEKSVSRIKIFGSDRRLDCVVAGAGLLDSIPKDLKRKPSTPGGLYFSAIPLSGERIAVFDFDNALLRFFAPLTVL